MAEPEPDVDDPITGPWSQVESDVRARALRICSGGFWGIAVDEGNATAGRTSTPHETRLRNGYPNNWRYQLIYQTNSRDSVKLAERAIADECRDYVNNQAPAGGGTWGSPPYYAYLAYYK